MTNTHFTNCDKSVEYDDAEDPPGNQQDVHGGVVFCASNSFGAGCAVGGCEVLVTFVIDASCVLTDCTVV